MANKTALQLLGQRKFRWYNNLGLLSDSMQEGYTTFRSLEDLDYVLKERYASRYASTVSARTGAEWVNVYKDVLSLSEAQFIEFVLRNRLTEKEV